MSNVYPDVERREKFLEKPLPSSEEAERAILGAILIDNAAFNQAVDVIKPEDFYSPLNRRVFQAMIDLQRAGKKIDPILIGEELKREGSLDPLGGVSTITNLSQGLPYHLDVGEYVKVVHDKSRVRQLIRTCNKITVDALAEETDFETLATQAESLMFGACEQPNAAQAVKLIDAFDESIAETRRSIETGVKTVGVPTGLRDLDELTGGLQKGELIILAARPSMGKSALAVKIGVTASDDERVVAYFSLEDPNRTTAARIIAQQAKFDGVRYRHAKLTQYELTQIEHIRGRLSRLNLLLLDVPRITPMQIRSKAQRIKAEYGRLDLIVVDYLQRVTPSRPVPHNRVQEVGQISNEMKETARDLDVPYLALSQLSRKCEDRNPPRPVISDLRDSGNIEQDADVVFLLYRDEYYRKTEQNEGRAEIIVAKQRNGPTDTVEVAFLKKFVAFEDLARDDAQQHL